MSSEIRKKGTENTRRMQNLTLKVTIFACFHDVRVNIQGSEG